MMRGVESRRDFDELSAGELFYAATIGDPRCQDPIKQSKSLARRLAELIGGVLAVVGIVGIVTAASWGGVYAGVEGGKFAYGVFSELPKSSQEGLIITGVLLAAGAYGLRRLPRI